MCFFLPCFPVCPYFILPYFHMTFFFFNSLHTLLFCNLFFITFICSFFIFFYQLHLMCFFSILSFFLIFISSVTHQSVSLFLYYFLISNFSSDSLFYAASSYIIFFHHQKGCQYFSVCFYIFTFTLSSLSFPCRSLKFGQFLIRFITIIIFFYAYMFNKFLFFTFSL